MLQNGRTSFELQQPSQTCWMKPVQSLTRWPKLKPGYSNIKGELLGFLNVLFDFASGYDCTSYPSYLILCLEHVLNIDTRGVLTRVFLNRLLFPSCDTGVQCKQLLQFSNFTWCKHTMWENKALVCRPDRCRVLWSNDCTSFWFVHLLNLSSFNFLFLSVSFFEWRKKNHIKWGEQNKKEWNKEQFWF